MDCKSGILDEIRDFQKTKSFLGNEWIKVMDL